MDLINFAFSSPARFWGLTLWLVLILLALVSVARGLGNFRLLSLHKVNSRDYSRRNTQTGGWRYPQPSHSRWTHITGPLGDLAKAADDLASAKVGPGTRKPEPPPNPPAPPPTRMDGSR